MQKHQNASSRECTFWILITCVEQHNTVVPHFAFQGQTPDEMYFGTGVSIPATLKKKRVEARAARLAHNRAVICERCKIEDTKPAMVTIGSNTS